MTNNKHTPGPWQVELCRVYHNSGKGRRNIAICLASQKPPSDEYEVFEDIANARLIAAAPELLAALEAAREFIVDGMAMGFVGMPEDEDVLEVIEKAISKAKGKSC